MNPALDKAVSQITTGFYAIAIATVVLGLLAVVIGRNFVGKKPRQRRAAAALVWAMGLLLLALFGIPKLFGGS